MIGWSEAGAMMVGSVTWTEREKPAATTLLFVGPPKAQSRQGLEQELYQEGGSDRGCFQKRLATRS